MVVCSRCGTTTSSHALEHVLWRGPRGSGAGASVHLLKLFHVLRHFRLVRHWNVHIILVVCIRSSVLRVFSRSKALVSRWGQSNIWVLDERWIRSNTTKVEFLVYYHWSLYILMHLNLLSRSIRLIHRTLNFNLLLLRMIRWPIIRLCISISIERFLIFRALLSHHLVHVSCGTVDNWRLGNSIRTTSAWDSWALTWVLTPLFIWLLAKVLGANDVGCIILRHVTQSWSKLLMNLSLLITRWRWGLLLHVAIGKWVLNTIRDCGNFLNRHVVWSIFLLRWTFVRLLLMGTIHGEVICSS